MDIITSDIALPVINIIGATTSILLTLIITDYPDHSFTSNHSCNNGNNASLALSSSTSALNSQCPGFMNNSEDNNSVEANISSYSDLQLLDKLTAQIIGSLLNHEIADASNYWKILESRILNSTENDTLFPSPSLLRPQDVLVQKLSHIINTIVEFSPKQQLSFISPFTREIDLHLRLRAYNLTLDFFNGDNPYSAITNLAKEFANIRSTEEYRDGLRILNFAKFIRDDYDWLRTKKMITNKSRALFYSVIRKFSRFVKTMIFTSSVILRSSNSSATNVNFPNTNNGYLYATGNKALFPPAHIGQEQKRPVFLWNQPTPDTGTAREGRWQLIYEETGVFTIMNSLWKERLCEGWDGDEDSVDTDNFAFTTSQVFDSERLKCSWKIMRDGNGSNNSGSGSGSGTGAGFGSVRILIGNEDVKQKQLFLLSEKYKDSMRDKTRNYRSRAYTGTEESLSYDVGNTYTSWDIIPLVYII